MSKLNLWQINNLYIVKDTSPERLQTFRACIITERVCTKIRPGHLAVSGALKRYPFYLRQDACKSRSYAAGGARYLQADLMLLTHAGCAFKDPRGRFGISYPIAVLRTEQSTAGEVKSDETRMAHAVLQHTAYTGDAFLRFVPLHCAVTAGTGQPPSCIVGLRCRKGCIRGAERELTCTGRPDGSGARSGR